MVREFGGRGAERDCGRGGLVDPGGTRGTAVGDAAPRDASAAGRKRSLRDAEQRERNTGTRHGWPIQRLRGSDDRQEHAGFGGDRVFLGDENLARLYSNLADGIKLMVREEDADTARKLLEENVPEKFDVE